MIRGEHTHSDSRRWALLSMLGLNEADLDHSDTCDAFSCSCGRVPIYVKGLRDLLERVTEPIVVTNEMVKCFIETSLADILQRAASDDGHGVADAVDSGFRAALARGQQVLSVDRIVEIVRECDHKALSSSEMIADVRQHLEAEITKA